MNDSEGAALFAAIQENPADLAPRLIYSDWLEEHDQTDEALTWRGQVAKSQPIVELYGSRSGSGYGYVSGSGPEYVSGYGSGDGYGDGYGFGHLSGYGEGYGYGSGEGSGTGYGDGFRYGFGYGSGYSDGYGYLEVQKQKAWIKKHKKLIEGRPVIGRQMLIWCGRGFAWIGQVEEMYAPGCYKLSNAGMLCNTGSESWMSIAANNNRSTYVYRHAPDGIVYTGPELHGAVEWKGELPGQDVR